MRHRKFDSIYASPYIDEYRTPILRDVDEDSIGVVAQSTVDMYVAYVDIGIE